MKLYFVQYPGHPWTNSFGPPAAQDRMYMSSIGILRCLGCCCVIQQALHTIEAVFPSADQGLGSSSDIAVAIDGAAHFTDLLSGGLVFLIFESSH